jgi:hypothetical protein
LTKAFDRVDHSTLLKKLYCCGFRGKIYNWLGNYLCGRTQVVRVNNQLSGALPITIGVPQGSVLGPLLFLIYVNGLFSKTFCGSITAFADDFAFAYAGQRKQHNITSIEHDLNLLSKWLQAHNLLLSNKTKVLHFKESQTLYCNIFYHVYGCNRGSNCVSNGCFEIKLVNDIRYLGVTIDASLNWKAHIEGLKTKLLLVSRKIYVLRQYCPLHLLRLVYFALVDSILLYGLSCWGSASKTILIPLYVRQKHILRLMTFKDRLSPSWPIFQQLSLLPLRHMFVFKVLKRFYIISGNNFVNYPDYSLRLNSQFRKHVPNFKSEFRARCGTIVAPIIFNNLLIEIRMCDSFSVFSKALKTWLKQNKDIEQLFLRKL